MDQSGRHSLLPSLVAVVEEIHKLVDGHWNYGMLVEVTLLVSKLLGGTGPRLLECSCLSNHVLSSMCFIDPEKAFVPHVILWAMLHEYGIKGPLLRAVQFLFNQSRSWFTLLAVSET